VNPNPGRSLALAAYDGGAIPNSIDADPSPGTIWLANKGRSPTSAQTTRLLPPTGRYNCHGLVFAARRTNIPPAGMPSAVDLDALLRRDRYALVPAEPHVGDVVVYRYRDGTVAHTGIVCRIEVLGRTQTVFVLSKWGALEECEHPVTDCPEDDCTPSFYRLT
jgi:hypothetical protein